MVGGRDWCAERDELFALRARFVPCWFACLRFIFGYARVRTPPLNPQRSCSWCRFLGFVNAMSSLWVFFFSSESHTCLRHTYTTKKCRCRSISNANTHANNYKPIRSSAPARARETEMPSTDKSAALLFATQRVYVYNVVQAKRGNPFRP